MVRLVNLCFILFVLSACSTTVDQSTFSGELLQAAVPESWHLIYRMNRSNTTSSEFVPGDESKENWTSKLVLESFDATTVNIDPIELLLEEVKQYQSRCKAGQHFNVFSGYENQYETSVRFFLCGKNEFSNRGEVSLIKAIRGNDLYYIIRLTRRVPAFEVQQQDAFKHSEIAAWSDYIRRIRLCDTIRVEHSCTNKGEPE